MTPTVTPAVWPDDRLAPLSLDDDDDGGDEVAVVESEEEGVDEASESECDEGLPIDFVVVCDEVVVEEEEIDDGRAEEEEEEWTEEDGRVEERTIDVEEEEEEEGPVGTAEGVVFDPNPILRGTVALDAGESFPSRIRYVLSFGASFGMVIHMDFFELGMFCPKTLITFNWSFEGPLPRYKLVAVALPMSRHVTNELVPAKIKVLGKGIVKSNEWIGVVYNKSSSE